MTKYRISFKGDILHGHSLPDVKQRFAELFRIVEPSYIEAIFSGSEMQLLGNLERDDVKKMQNVLLGIGMKTSIARDAEADESAAPWTAAAVADLHTQSDTELLVETPDSTPEPVQEDAGAGEQQLLPEAPAVAEPPAAGSPAAGSPAAGSPAAGSPTAGSAAASLPAQGSGIRSPIAEALDRPGPRQERRRAAATAPKVDPGDSEEPPAPAAPSYPVPPAPETADAGNAFLGPPLAAPRRAPPSILASLRPQEEGAPGQHDTRAATTAEPTPEKPGKPRQRSSGKSASNQPSPPQAEPTPAKKTSTSRPGTKSTRAPGKSASRDDSSKGKRKQVPTGSTEVGQANAGRKSLSRPSPGQPDARKASPEDTSATVASAPGQPAPGKPAPGKPASGRPAPGKPAPGRPAPGRPAPDKSRAARTKPSAANPKAAAAPKPATKARPSTASAAVTPAGTAHRAADKAPERQKSRRRKQPGAPNLFDLRLAEEAKPPEGEDTNRQQLRRAPIIAAAIVTLAFVLVALRFWAESHTEPAYGLGSVAVNPRQGPVVEVNDQLVLHERSGLDIEKLPLAALAEGSIAAGPVGAPFQFFSNGEILLLQRAASSSAPAWLQTLLGIETNDDATLSRCNISARKCTALRDELAAATFVIEPRSNHIILADLARNRLEKLDPNGNRLAVRNMALPAPVSLTLAEGILYLTRGDLNTIKVLKPDTADFAEELAVISPDIERLGASNLIFPTAIAQLQQHWWVVLQSRDAATAGLFRLNSDWKAVSQVAIPAGAHPGSLVPWAGKLLAPDARNRVIYRIAADGEVEAPFNEESITGLLEERSAELSRTRALQGLVLAILLLGAGGLFAAGSVQSLQGKLYRHRPNVDEKGFDITSEEIEWLAPEPGFTGRLRGIGIAMGSAAAVMLIAAFLLHSSPPVLLAICLFFAGLGAYYFSLQQSSGCHLGLLGDQLILVDHNKTYRVGRGPKVQYYKGFIMIDDVVVFLGNRLLPQFSGDQLQNRFAPMVTRGIKVDRTTLRLKMMNSRHPLLYGGGGLVVCVVLALLLLVLS